MEAKKKAVVRKIKTTMTPPDPTSPGDVIEIAVTAEVTNGRGQKFWAKAGLSSTHREGETTTEAHNRVQTFVIDTTEALVEEWRS